MAIRSVTIDDAALRDLGEKMDLARRQLLGQLGERGYQLLRREVPRQTGNLQQGVSPPEIDYEKGEGVLTVTARSGATGSRTATVFNRKGKAVKTVTLRPQPAYNYAEVVAMGNRKARLSPSTARAFLIPVNSKPSNEGYLQVGGQIYVVRMTRKGQKANPFDLRVAEQLGKDAPKIAEALLRKHL